MVQRNTSRLRANFCRTKTPYRRFQQFSEADIRCTAIDDGAIAATVAGTMSKTLVYPWYACSIESGCRWGAVYVRVRPIEVSSVPVLRPR